MAIYVRAVVNEKIPRHYEEIWTERLKDGSILIHRKDGKKVRLWLP